MRERIWRMLACAAFGLALVSCAKAPAPRAALLPADYPDLAKSVDRLLDYPIPGHGDDARLIFMNGTAFAAASAPKDGAVTFPEGSVVIKEIYEGLKPAAGQAPAMLTAMVKAPGDPAAIDGWIWVVKDLSTGTESVMDADFCATCHAAANEAHPYGDKNPAEAFRDGVFILPSAAGAGGDGY